MLIAPTLPRALTLLEQARKRKGTGRGAYEIVGGEPMQSQAFLRLQDLCGEILDFW